MSFIPSRLEAIEINLTMKIPTILRDINKEVMETSVNRKVDNNRFFIVIEKQLTGDELYLLENYLSLLGYKDIEFTKKFIAFKL